MVACYLVFLVCKTKLTLIVESVLLDSAFVLHPDGSVWCKFVVILQLKNV